MCKQSLKTAWLITNYTCNNSCEYCYATAMIKKNKKEVMTFDYAKQVMSELSRIGVKDCLLIGGEPTLISWLPETIKYGSQVGLNMKIVSNGRLMSDKRFLKKLIDSGVSHISISLEASNRQKHNEICGTDCFDETIDSIINCVESNISFNSISTISDGNKNDVVSIAKLLNSLGVKNILFNYGVPSVETEFFESDNVFMSPRDLANVAIDAYRTLKKENIKVFFFSTIPLCAYGDTMHEMVVNGYISGYGSCQMFSGYGVAFEPSGKILPCTHFVNTELMNGRDDKGEFIFQKNLDKIWDDEDGVRKKFEKALWKYTSSECEHCDYWGKCVGGCPLIWKVFNPQEHLNRLAKGVNES